MDSTYLLVIDTHPESAESINSMMRNSGMNVHVLQAGDPRRCEALLQEFHPVLMIYQPSAGDTFPLSRAGELAARHGCTLAARFPPDDPYGLLEALKETACIGLRTDADQALAGLVGALAEAHRANRGQSRNRQEMEELQQRFDLLLDTTMEAVAYLHEGLHVHANAAYREALELIEPEQLHSLSLLEVAHSEQTNLKALIRELGQGKLPETAPLVTIRPRAGEPFEARLHFRPARFNGEECIQMILRRADESAQLQTALRSARRHDPLTRALTRAAFLQRLQQRLDDPGDQPAALYWIQPNAHERIAELGLGQQDDAARTTAEALRTILQAGDMMARVTDSGFSVHAARASRTDLKELAGQLRAAVTEAWHERDGLPGVQPVGVGFVTLGAESRDAEDAIHQAREAWQRAAESEQGAVRYRPEAASADGHEKEQEWAERIRYALNNDDFYSVQHAIVELEGEGEGLFENRTYLHQEGGDVGPEAFWDAAERNGLASTIDRSVIPGLLRSISGVGDRHIINVSGNSLQDFSFPSWFARQLGACEVEGNQLILQLPAAAVGVDPKSARRLVEETAPLGCGISIANVDDDPGILERMQELSPAMVKLRPNLVRNLKANPSHKSAIRTVVAVADGCGTAVIADEVRDSADMATLWQCGVKLVGGNFLQQPSRVIGE